MRRISINEEGHAHALTFSTYRRAPIFLEPTSVDLFLDAFDVARQKQNFDVLAYVVMPEHVHLLIAPQGDYAMPTILQAIKQQSAKRLLGHLEKASPVMASRLRVPKKGGGFVRRFWQAGGGFHRNVVTLKYAQTLVDYIHQNPVRRGLCSLASDYEWSSFGAYHGEAVRVPVSLRWFTGED